MKKKFSCITSTRAIIEGHPAPVEALIVFSQESGIIQEVFVKGKVAECDFLQEKKKWKSEANTFHDFQNDVVMPGIIDVSVHFQEPSRAYWEGFFTGTKAACAGGVTTVFDMPFIGEPYTTNVEALEKRIKSANDRLWADCGFLGFVQDDSIEHSKALIEAGIYGLVVNIGPQIFNGVFSISISGMEKLLETINLTGAQLPIIALYDPCTDSTLNIISPYRLKNPEDREVKAFDAESLPPKLIPIPLLKTESGSQKEEKKSNEILTKDERSARKVRLSLRGFIAADLPCIEKIRESSYKSSSNVTITNDLPPIQKKSTFNQLAAEKKANNPRELYPYAKSASISNILQSYEIPDPLHKPGIEEEKTVKAK